MTTGERVVRILTRAVAGLLFVAALVWPVDWATWRIRTAMGGGSGEVTVSRFTVASLKGNKEEYYYEGTGPADCSRSLFSQGGDSACWWLRRHTNVIVRY